MNVVKMNKVMKLTTIRDVAKDANVSVATVSRVMNDNGYVNPDTREKVKETIARLNYQPNSVARSLYKKESKTIGIMVPDIMNPYFPELVRGVEDYLIEKGFTTILCNTDEDPDKERLYLDVMKQRYVDGAIVVSNTLKRDLIDQYDMPVVALDRSIHENVPTFMVNNTVGAEQATQHLIDIGCKRIAHVRGPEHVENATARYEGYYNIMQQTGWFNERYVVQGNFDQKQSAKAVKQLLQEQPEVDGIFAGNDIMALGALKGAESLGIKVPQELAIIGFDGIDLSSMTIPELSTMSQPIYEMSTQAADALMSLISGEATDETEHIYQPTLEWRQSTDRMRKED